MMFSVAFRFLQSFSPNFWNYSVSILLLLIITICFNQNIFPQQFNQQYIAPQQNTQNYMRNSSAFRQEIARMEITVSRGKTILPITQVPRVQKDDVIKVRMIDEAVNGIKLDQSLYDWTFLIAYYNPNRKFVDKVKNNISYYNDPVSEKLKIENGKLPETGKPENPGNPESTSKPLDPKALKAMLKPADPRQSSVTQEIQFRKTGWYKEYSFTVPYDAQPVFFLYPRPKYRDKIMKLINKNYNEVRKLGEKTIEIAGAYAQISSFLGDLQGVISGVSNSGYGNGGYGGSYGNSGGYYNGGGSTYYSGGGYNTGSYGGGYSGYLNNSNNVGYNWNQLMAQTVERLAKSFNIQLPQNCWQSGLGTTYQSNSYSYNSPNNNLNPYGISQDMVSRVQCIAKNVRLEDFDLSIAKLLQQGGVIAAAQLVQQYPQFYYWINLAATAIDFIIKITKKSPLRIVPTVVQSSDGFNAGNSVGNSAYSNYGNGGNYQSGYQQQNFNNNNNGNPGTSYTPSTPNSALQQATKISLFAENQPDDSQFVTAYPIVLHKWQAEPDPDVISLRPPILAEPCLHAGVNILKSTDLNDTQLEDSFTREYRLEMSSPNGFKKEFPLKKNAGLGGWELNITPQDLASFPKIEMLLQTVIKGTRGFNEISSPPFPLPLSLGGTYEVTQDSQRNFAVGAKRKVTIKNILGGCQCVQAVIYQPSFGGQFVFEAGDRERGLQYSPDGKEISFEVDATTFQPGAGTIELKTYGGESTKLNVKLYPAPPNVTDFKIRRGDREILLTGERLEQVQFVNINGKRAINPYFVDSGISNNANPAVAAYGNQPAYNQPNYVQNPAQANYNQPNQTGFPQPNSATPLNSANPTNPSANSVNYPQNTLSPNQKVFVFQDANAVVEGNLATLELGLEDNRMFQYPQRVQTLSSRPQIIANEKSEIQGTFLKDEGGRMNDEVKTTVQNPKSKVQNSKATASQFTPLPTAMSSETASIDSSELSISTQNKLTDYNFRTENLSIETGIEGSTVNPNELPQARFEVLDTNNLRINFTIPQETKKYLGGRRIKFRVRDRERGDSDWYLIKQTFIRMPKVEAVKCSNSTDDQTATPVNPNTPTPCQITGTGLDYIQQISIDGGQTWYPQSPSSLQAQLMSDGKSTAMIPLLSNKKSLMMKLRDYPKAEGLFISNFIYSNTIKVLKNKPQTEMQTGMINQNPNGFQNPPINPQVQTNQPNTGKATDIKPKRKQKN